MVEQVKFESPMMHDQTDNTNGNRSRFEQLLAIEKGSPWSTVNINNKFEKIQTHQAQQLESEVSFL